MRERHSEDVADTVRVLRDKLERYRHRWAGWADGRPRVIPTGLMPIDRALPRGGLPGGAITEILSESPGIGAMSLAMRLAAQCLGGEQPHVGRAVPAKNVGRAVPAANVAMPSGPGGDDRSIVLVDTFGDFYPPAAWQYGLMLDRLIVLRPRSVRDAFWAVDQALRCSAVAAVIAPLDGFDERGSRRLQLAAESSGCLGLILRPARQRTKVKSFAAVQMLIEGAVDELWVDQSTQAPPLWSLPEQTYDYDSGLCRITLLRVREGTPTEPLLVDLHHETGVSLVHPVPGDRSAARTG